MITLKEHVKNGLIVLGLVSTFYGIPNLAENYLPTPQRAVYIPMYPRAINKAEVDFDLGASLVDEDGDGSTDKKTWVVASRQGFHRWDLPITEKDIQMFKRLTSRLE